jgi:hypothetical protein
MKTVKHLLRQFGRRHGRDAAVSTLLYATVVATCFWGGGLLSLDISVTLNVTVSCLFLAHVVRSNFFGASEFCLSAAQRLVMLSALLSVIILLMLFAHANMASPQRFKLVFLPLLFASMTSVYVDFIFAGIIEKMVARS